MGISNKFFGGSIHSNDPLGGKPPIYGGNGTNEKKAAIVNCASMSMANYLIDNFISEKHGELEIDWNRTIEFFIKSQSEKNSKIRVIGITCSDGSKHKYYFDVTRPMNATDKLLGFE